MPSRFDVFFEPGALSINAARQAHLATLGIEFAGKRILEVGAGIGLHTAFFEERGCQILSTDGNSTNVAEMMRRYPARNLGVLDLDRPADLTDLGLFDIIYCYGTLYHLRDPSAALARLSGICRGQILVETIVALGAHVELHNVSEPRISNQALFGVGSRPTRAWVMKELADHFGHAYATLDQPSHPEFETDWSKPRSGGNLRAIFVGSKVPLALPTLCTTLPERHKNAPPATPETAPARVWIDVGAYRGLTTRQAALDDPTLIVHAFEPVPELHDELSCGPKNWFTHAMAVTDRDGFATFRVNKYVGASSLLPMDEVQRAAWIGGNYLASEREIIVPTIRLDTFFAQARIREVEYLKIDAQGSDFDVVRSAGERIRDIRKIRLEVAITDRQLYLGAADKHTICQYLAERGFTLVAVERQTRDQEENLTFERDG